MSDLVSTKVNVNGAGVNLGPPSTERREGVWLTGQVSEVRRFEGKVNEKTGAIGQPSYGVTVEYMGGSTRVTVADNHMVRDLEVGSPVTVKVQFSYSGQFLNCNSRGPLFVMGR